MQVKNHSRSHRTVAVFDFTGADKDYIERAKRLNQSLNGDNIKADVVSIHDGVAVAGFEPTTPQAASSTTDDSIQAWAKEAGYTQVLLSRTGK